MATEREKAKGAIVSQEPEDPELVTAINEAKASRIEAIKEKNRHTETQTKANLGLFGILGAKENAPNNIAFVAVVSAFIGFVACLVVAGAKDQTQIEFWSRNAERSLAVALTALAYIFGRGSSPS